MPKGMLYEVCTTCRGTGKVLVQSETLEKVLDCTLCQPLRVVETGLTLGQVDRLVKESQEAVAQQTRARKAGESPLRKVAESLFLADEMHKAQVEMFKRNALPEEP